MGWSSDVCSSDLGDYSPVETRHDQARAQRRYDRDAFHAEALVAYWWNREKTLHPQSYLRDTDGNPFYGDAARAVSIGGHSWALNPASTFRPGLADKADWHPGLSPHSHAPSTPARPPP